MSFELKGAYAMLLDLIYMCGGKLYDEPRFIAGHMNCSVRAWGNYRAALIERGKISVQDGIISNFRADKELITQRSFQDKQRINASQPRKNNGLDEAMAQPKTSHTDTDTDKEERTEAKASDASVDFAKQLWDRGVSFLGRHGTQDRQARTLIGKWRKAYTDTDIFEAFAACSKEGIIDPVPWITAKLAGKDKPNGKSSRGEKFLRSFLAGAEIPQGMDIGQDSDPSRPLLARR